MLGFAVAYGAIGVRLAVLGFTFPYEDGAHAPTESVARPNIIDRNGYLLATDLPAVSLYAEPRRISDVDEAVEGLHRVFPDIDADQLYQRLTSKTAFVWLKRKIGPAEQRKVKDLGLPAIGFRSEITRFYPTGREPAHILGLTNVDNQGISGMEKWIDEQTRKSGKQGDGSATALEPVQLSLDTRIQHILHDELAQALTRFQAQAAGAVVLNAKTGEVVALVSLPDFDLNDPVDAQKPDRLNRISASAAEMGSTIKTFTTAMALEVGGASLTTMFDASKPLVVGRQRVHDSHSRGRPLSLEEIFLFSSNIGSAQEARVVGVNAHRDFLKRAGLLTRLQTELPEVARPVQPRAWTQPTSITASFGHGFASTPLQTAVGIAAVLNHGRLIPPTFLRRTEQEAESLSTVMISERTSQTMRYLYRLNGVKGSGRHANIDGFRVGGKTGTAEKVVKGRYAKNSNYNVFSAAFPMDDPQFVLLVVVDDPKPEKPGAGITAATTAAPVAGAIIRRSAEMLGVRPRFSEDAQVTLAEFEPALTFQASPQASVEDDD
jgi:cell division protein FtsI (penicillin-binding protein 3)